MRPLFEEGEHVILCSKDRPELNGDAVVLEVESLEDKVKRHTGAYPELHWVGGDPGYSYKLTIPNDLIEEYPKLEKRWSESALRKKHEPGEDYDTIMDFIKSSIPVAPEKTGAPA